MDIKNTVLVGCVVLLLISCTAPPDSPEAQEGVLDLTASSLDGPIPLSGEWEFYWEELLYPAHFRDLEAPSPSYRHVPHNWSTYSVNGRSLPGYGNATYRLVIQTDGSTKRLGLRFKKIYTAYRLFVNGEQILEMGRVEHDFRQSIVDPFVKTATLPFLRG